MNTTCNRILPAYPLFVKDPNFSIWTGADELNGQNVETWFGAKKKIYGFLKTGGETYCFLGNAATFEPFGVKKAEQIALAVTAFSTDYTFRCGKATLRLRFVSPVPPDDLELLSLPVCYLSYALTGAKDAELSLFVHRGIAYNDRPETADKRVRGGVVTCDGFESAFLGLVRQLPLSNTGDLVGADWGYWYLAGAQAYLADEPEVCAYLANGYTDFIAEGQERYLAAVNRTATGTFLLGFDDCVAIEYFGQYLKSYYLETHTILDALTYAWHHLPYIDAQLAAFDEGLKVRAARIGDGYLQILYAALRQSMAAHKLVRDGQSGELLWLSKECGSCGCIATVDVSYPSAPLFLLYNPDLVKGMLRPIFKFARMPVWTFDCAPHDAGTYPVCCGQLYGLKQGDGKHNRRLGEGDFWADMKTHYPVYMLPADFDAYDFDKQMPVETSADMLILLFGAYRADKDLRLFTENLDLCKKWVGYLVDDGLRPENQLCTDDFAGHLKNNLNLSIKAAVGIAAYAELLTAVGERETARKYRRVAENFAADITALGERYTHLPLTWDTADDTFGLKYNLAFDKMFGFGLFGRTLREKEVDCYLDRAAIFGTPLDSRQKYTKSDWLIWVACLTDDPEKRDRLLAPVRAYLTESPDRVPFGDWYETDDGKYLHFRARSVQGGCFILLLQ